MESLDDDAVLDVFDSLTSPKTETMKIDDPQLLPVTLKRYKET